MVFILFFRLWVAHLEGTGFDFIVFVPPLTILFQLICVWTCGIFFWWFQRSPVSGCSTASCDFGALAGGDECTSFYAAFLRMTFFVIRIFLS